MKRERFPAKPRWMKATSYDYFRRMNSMKADRMVLDKANTDPRLIRFLSKVFKVVSDRLSLRFLWPSDSERSPL